MESLFGDDGAKKPILRRRSPKQEANDALFLPLARFFFPSGVGPRDAKRIMACISNLRPKNATPEKITLAIAAFDLVFPKLPAGSITIEALTKHWDKLLRGPRPPKPTLPPGCDWEHVSETTRRAYEAWKNW